MKSEEDETKEHLIQRSRRDILKALKEIEDSKRRTVSSRGVSNEDVEVLSTPSLRKQLRSALDQCISSLPRQSWMKLLIECGDRLFRLAEYEIADAFCYSICFEKDKAIGNDETYLTLYVMSEFGKSNCRYRRVSKLDPKLTSKHSVKDLISCLSAYTSAMEKILEFKHETQERLYWLLHNGTVHTYEVAKYLIGCGYTECVMRDLTFCILTIESMIKLSTLKYLSWRVELYALLASCYASKGRHDESWATVSRGLAQLEELFELEMMDSNLSKKNREIFENSKNRLSRLRDGQVVMKSLLSKEEEEKIEIPGEESDETQKWYIMADVLNASSSSSSKKRFALRLENVDLSRLDTKTMLVLMRCFLGEQNEEEEEEELTENRFEILLKFVRNREEQHHQLEIDLLEALHHIRLFSNQNVNFSKSTSPNDTARRIEKLAMTLRAVATSSKSCPRTIRLVRDAISALWSPYMCKIFVELKSSIRGTSQSSSPQWLQDLAIKILLSLHNAIESIDLNAPALRSLVAFRLGMLLTSKGNEDWHIALQVLRSSLESLRRSRGEYVNFDLRRPSEEDSLVLMHLEATTTDVSPERQSKVFCLRDMLATIHVEIVGLIMRAEIRLGNSLSELSSSSSPLSSSKVDEKTHKEQTTTAAAPPTEQIIERYVEDRLLQESGENLAWRAILELQCGELSDDPKRKRARLESAMELLDQASKSEKKSIESFERIKLNTNSPPIVLSRSCSSITLRRTEFNEMVSIEKKRQEAKDWILYGKLEDSGTPVSSNNVDLLNCGVLIPYNQREITVSGLEPNKSYVFACSFVSASGAALGRGITETTRPITAMLPLPLMMIWNRVCQASRKIVPETSRKAARHIFDYYVKVEPKDLNWKSNPSSSMVLRRDRLDVASKQSRRFLVMATHTLTELDKQRRNLERDLISCTKGTVRSLRGTQIALLRTMAMLNIAIEVSVSISDAPLIMDSVRRAYNTMLNLVRFECTRDRVLHCLSVCYQAGLAVSREKMSRSFQEIHTCIALELIRVMKQKGQDVSSIVKTVVSKFASSLERDALVRHLASLESSETVLRSMDVESPKARLGEIEPNSTEYEILMNVIVRNMKSSEDAVRFVTDELDTRQEQGNKDENDEEKEGEEEKEEEKLSLGVLRLKLISQIVSRNGGGLKSYMWLNDAVCEDAFDSQTLEVLRRENEDDVGEEKEEKQDELFSTDDDSKTNELLWLSHVEMLKGECLLKSMIEEETNAKHEGDGPYRDIAYLPDAKLSKYLDQNFQDLSTKDLVSMYLTSSGKQSLVKEDSENVENQDEKTNEENGENQESDEEEEEEDKKEEEEEKKTTFDFSKISIEQVQRVVGDSEARLCFLALSFRGLKNRDVLSRALKHFARAASRARHARAWRKLREIVGHMWNVVRTLWISPEDVIRDHVSFYKTSEMLLEMISELHRKGIVDLGVAEERDNLSVSSEDSQQGPEEEEKDNTSTDDRVTLADAKQIAEFVAFALRIEHQAEYFARVVRLNDKFMTVFGRNNPLLESVMLIGVLSQDVILQAAKEELREAEESHSEFKRVQEEKAKNRRRRRRRQKGPTEEELAAMRENERLESVSRVCRDVKSREQMKLDDLKDVLSSIDRDKNTCMQTIESCRAMRKRFWGSKDGGDVKTIVASYEKAVMQCRLKQERCLLVQALNELADFELASGQERAAIRHWCDGVDAIFSVYDAIKQWRDLVANCNGDDVIAKRGFFEIAIGICMLSKIVRHDGKSTDLGRSREHVLCAVCLVKEMLKCSLSHPMRLRDFRNSQTETLWPAFDPFLDLDRLRPSDLIDALEFLCSRLLGNDEVKDVLPLSILMEQIASRSCRSSRIVARARTLRLTALIQLGFISDAISLLVSMMKNKTERSVFSDWIQVDNEENANVLTSLIDLCHENVSTDLFCRENTFRVHICVMRLMLRLASLCSGSSSSSNNELQFDLLRVAKEMFDRIVSSMSEVKKVEEVKVLMEEDTKESPKIEEDTKEMTSLEDNEEKEIVTEERNVEETIIIVPRNETELNILCTSLVLMSQYYELSENVSHACKLVTMAMKRFSTRRHSLDLSFWLRCRLRRVSLLETLGQYKSASKECDIALREASKVGEKVWYRRVLVTRSRLSMIEGDLSTANKALSELTSSDMTSSVKAYVLHGDLCLDFTDHDLKKTRSIELFTKAEKKLESDLKCLGWNGFLESTPSVRANVYISGVFELAEIKLRLSKLLSPEQGLLKAIEGWQALKHTHKSSASMYVRTLLSHSLSLSFFLSLDVYIYTHTHTTGTCPRN